MKPELDRLRQQGFLDTDRIYYTSPGNHDMLMEMDRELPEKIGQAAQGALGVIVLLGTNCYFNPSSPAFPWCVFRCRMPRHAHE